MDTSTDELTGLFTRGYFEERLKEEIAQHSRDNNVFSIFMIDLDNFKAYNDVYGHPAGDKILRRTGRIIKKSVRDADQAFRYGGDEFTVLLPDTTVEDARVVAERVRETIAREMERKEVAVTCSIGLACYPSDGVMAGELVTVADIALYSAKRAGGNRVYSSKILAKPPGEARIPESHIKPGSLEVYDIGSIGHSRKVSIYAIALAEKIGLSHDEVSALRLAALLHDIGKVGIPDEVLSKKGELNKKDWEAIKAHPKLGANIVGNIPKKEWEAINTRARLGANIIGNIPKLAPVVNSILYHHERWDGGGYPKGLKGEQIPIEARIIAIANAFVAMTSALPYRPAFSLQETIDELRKCAGSQFDPKLVEVFIETVETGLLKKDKTDKDVSGEQPGP